MNDQAAEFLRVLPIRTAATELGVKERELMRAVRWDFFAANNKRAGMPRFSRIKLLGHTVIDGVICIPLSEVRRLKALMNTQRMAA